MSVKKRSFKNKFRELFLFTVFGLVAWQVLELASRVSARSSSPDSYHDSFSSQRDPASMDGGRDQKLHFHPRKNERYTYSFLRKISIDGLSNSIPEIDYQGKFYVDVLSSEDSGFDALITDEVTGQVIDPPISLLVRIDQAGKTLKILSSSVQGESAQQHLNILKDLVANWVFPLESDTVGNYQVSFSQPVFDNGFLRVSKRKISYLKSKSLTPEILSSSHQLSWALDLNLPYAVSGVDSTRMGSSKLAISSESRYQIDFLGEEASRIGAGKLAGISHEETLALSVDLSRAPGSRRAPNTHFSWAELTKRLGLIGSLSSAEQLELFGDLLDYLRNHKTDMKDLTAFLTPAVMAQGASSAIFKMTVGALATLGTPEAQAALIGVYEDPTCPISGKGTILSSLTTTQAMATPATREFLIDESQNQTNSDLASGALWALGSSISGDGSNADATSQKAVQSIEQAWSATLASSSPEGQEMVLLDAMGNSGSSQFLPILETVIADPSDPTLQSKAIFSLRFIDTSDAEGLLIQELGDPNPNLRLASAKAMTLAPWSAAFSAPLQGCVAHEQVPEIKSTCQTILQNQNNG